MSQKIAVMLNTNKMGGAERSLLLQLAMVPSAEYTFFVPKLDGQSTIKAFIEEHNLGWYCEYNYPRNLYNLSRSKILPGLSFLFSALKLLLWDSGPDLRSYDHVYLNGNKVAFLFFLLNFRMKFEGRVTWHLRDYYHHSFAGNLLWKMMTNVDKRQLEIVCNSHSVKNGLADSPWSQFRSRVVYNPSGSFEGERNPSEIKTIGFVSMMAPWKGVHEILFFSWLYEKELKEAGVEEIKIYGDSIYQTAGEHSHYKEELKALSEKFPSTLIRFEGLKDPKEIFSQIDCLIHYSLDAEPFGRVLIEAYEAGVPVITTGLGGAGEIIESNVNGYKVHAYDRRDLMNKIKNLASNNVLRMRFVTKSKTKAGQIQKNIAAEMEKVLSAREVS